MSNKFLMDKQQDLAVEHRELDSVFSDNVVEKNGKKDVCMHKRIILQYSRN